MHELDHIGYNSQSLTLLTVSLVYSICSAGSGPGPLREWGHPSAFITHRSHLNRTKRESRVRWPIRGLDGQWEDLQEGIQGQSYKVSGGQNSINHHCAYSSSHWERQYNAVQRGRGKYFVCWWILPSSPKKENNGIQITLKINEEKQREIYFYFYNPTLTRSSPDRQLLDFWWKVYFAINLIGNLS